MGGGRRLGTDPPNPSQKKARRQRGRGAVTWGAAVFGKAACREGLRGGYRGWTPGSASSPALQQQHLPPHQAVFPAVPILFPSPLSLFSALPPPPARAPHPDRPAVSGRERGRMDAPKIENCAPGAQAGPVASQVSSPGRNPRVPRPPGPPDPRFPPPVFRCRQIPQALGLPSPSLPATGAGGSRPGSTFCELKDWVQWYRTRLSLGQWAGLAASGASGASAGLAASLSSAEMGHQLQLVGVRLLGVAMTARNQRQERRRLRRGGSLSPSITWPRRACPSPPSLPAP